MTKIICNVYKDADGWIKPPPGIGDYIRGCAYLFRAQDEGPFAGRFAARLNLDLAPAASRLERGATWHRADPAGLAAAAEYFAIDRDGDVAEVIAAFLDSDREVLFVSTNRSWRGVDAVPPLRYLAPIRAVFDCDDGFDPLAAEVKRAAGAGYALLHLRDEDRTSPHSESVTDGTAYRRRVDHILDTDTMLASVGPPERTICISNNAALRADICRTRGYIDPGTLVRNTGFTGTFSDGELSNMLMIRDAGAMLSITPFAWDSGFSVWASRLFDVSARFINAATDVGDRPTPRKRWGWLPPRWRAR